MVQRIASAPRVIKPATADQRQAPAKTGNPQMKALKEALLSGLRSGEKFDANALGDIVKQTSNLIYDATSSTELAANVKTILGELQRLDKPGVTALKFNGSVPEYKPLGQLIRDLQTFADKKVGDLQKAEGVVSRWGNAKGSAPEFATIKQALTDGLRNDGTLDGNELGDIVKSMSNLIYDATSSKELGANLKTVLGELKRYDKPGVTALKFNGAVPEYKPLGQLIRDLQTQGDKKLSDLKQAEGVVSRWGNAKGSAPEFATIKQMLTDGLRNDGALDGNELGDIVKSMSNLIYGARSSTELSANVKTVLSELKRYDKPGVTALKFNGAVPEYKPLGQLIRDLEVSADKKVGDLRQAEAAGARMNKPAPVSQGWKPKK